MNRRPILLIIYFAIVTIQIVACNPEGKTTTPSPTGTASSNVSTQGSELVATVEPVDLTPTSLDSSTTPIALAASVNGEGIPLSTYQAELERFKANSGTSLATNTEGKVLEDLIDQVLLAQFAHKDGFMVDDVLLETHIQELSLSDQALSDWITTNGYTQEGFYQAMKRSIAAAWMRDQIIAEVSDTAEQVHARQILLYNSTEADAIYAQLQAGTDFGTLVSEIDPVTQGTLGWFPRGYLTVPELDEIVFDLEIGKYSPVIQTSLGYHIVQVLERNPKQPLTAAAQRTLRAQAIAQWLENKRNDSEILILLP